MPKSSEMDKINFRLVLSFTNAYERLYQQGQISEEQLDRVSTLLDNLLDNYQQYSKSELVAKLAEIFPDHQ